MCRPGWEARAVAEGQRFSLCLASLRANRSLSLILALLHAEHYYLRRCHWAGFSVDPLITTRKAQNPSAQRDGLARLHHVDYFLLRPDSCEICRSGKRLGLVPWSGTPQTQLLHGVPARLLPRNDCFRRMPRSRVFI